MDMDENHPGPDASVTQMGSKGMVSVSPRNVANILRQDIANLANVNPHELSDDVPLDRVGMDSLLILELKDLVEAKFKARVPMNELFNGPSLKRLTQLVTEQWQGPAQLTGSGHNGRPITHETNPSRIQLRAEFPTFENLTYLNYSTMGLVPQSAGVAVRRAEEELQKYAPGSREAEAFIDHSLLAARETMASLLNVSPRSIALVENVSVAVNIVLWGMRWSSGDHLVTTDEENPGVLAAVKSIARRLGLEYSIAQVSDAPNSIAAIEECLRPETRLIVVSHVLWSSGKVLDSDSLGRLSRNRRRVLVDGAQSLGVLPVDLSQSAIDSLPLRGANGSARHRGWGDFISVLGRSHPCIRPSLGGEPWTRSAARPVRMPDGLRLAPALTACAPVFAPRLNYTTVTGRRRRAGGASYNQCSCFMPCLLRSQRYRQLPRPSRNQVS
jgi:acyl carrier protein